MNKFTQRLWLLGALAAGLTGCGGGGSSDTGVGGLSPTPPTATNTPPTVSAEPLVVVTSGASTSLTATGNDVDGDTLSYSWTQTRGTSVTGQQGFNTPNPGFTPAVGQVSPVETLTFRVEVSDGRASASTNVDVVVARDATRAAFVDGTNGSDTSGDGSIARPYATISTAINANGATDLYIKALPDDEFYDETARSVRLDDGRSLYGGFGAGWIRDAIELKSVVVTDTFGMTFGSVDQSAEISGMEVRATAPSADDLRRTPYLPVRAFLASGGTRGLTIRHNRFITEDATDAAVTNGNRGGSSLAVKVSGLPSAEISNNVIIAGNGAPGKDGEPGSGLRSSSAPRGGSGGAGGTGSNENGSRGANGGAANASVGCGMGGSGGSGNIADDGSNGARGCSGPHGADGIGGVGYGNYRTSSLSGGFVLAASTAGSAGQHGGGGGGGGGGEAGALGANGGRGGDGGAGGRGARGTPPAIAGGASIGVEVYSVTDVLIRDNEITTGTGGRGGEQSPLNEGEAGKFGFGGNSGEGAVDPGGDGGDGGRGGDGGNGGVGGTGAGGPSFAIYLGESSAPIVEGNTLQTGVGGERGLRGRQSVPEKGWYARDGWSVGIFTPIDTLDLSGIGSNDFLIGEVRRDAVSANIANPEGEIILP
jgi:hypothetical protein